eukprot:6558617-Heterocapsa_arctica.AAC.1
MTLRAGAAPGPSGWWNSHILAAMDVTGGADAILGFAGLVAAGRITGRAADLWNAAVLEPVDCGEAVQEDPAARPKRKLRPIGLSEALVKLAECICIDAAMAGIRAAIEPVQLGCGTPDGVVIA